MIRVDDLKKNYGQNMAVDGISFQASKGEIFGLLVLKMSGMRS